MDKTLNCEKCGQPTEVGREAEVVVCENCNLRIIGYEPIKTENNNNILKCPVCGSSFILPEEYCASCPVCGSKTKISKLKQTENTESDDNERKSDLDKSQFYLVVFDFGSCVKTKNPKLFNKIKDWLGVVFSDIVYNQERLNFRIGDKAEGKEWVRSIKESDLDDTKLFDYYNLKNLPNNHTIKEIYMSSK